MRFIPEGFVGIALLAVALPACETKTQCGPIGYVSCQGDKVVECLGPDKGGDADGELKTITDCASLGQRCMDDLVRGVSVAGCVSQACYDTKVIQCFSPGSAHCSMGKYLLTCTPNANGCQTYVSFDCSKDGNTCVDVGQSATCSAP